VFQRNPNFFVLVGAAAEALAGTVTKEDLARKQLYPAFPQIRDISAQVAAAVADVAYEKGEPNFLHGNSHYFISLQFLI